MLNLMKPHKENPAGLEQLEAESRAKERREKEAAKKKEAADKAVENQLAVERAKAEEEAKKKALVPDVAVLRRECQEAVSKAKQALEAKRAEVKAAEVHIGNLEGAIITAGDIQKTSPERAIATLQKAKALFEEGK